MKEEVRKVMRYSGPRMMLRHPLLTIFHLIDDRQEEPVRPESIGQDTKTSKTECPGPASSFKPSLEESSPKNWATKESRTPDLRITNALNITVFKREAVKTKHFKDYLIWMFPAIGGI